MENLYTETQVKELLRQQRKICAKRSEHHDEVLSVYEMVIEAHEPKFPAPIQAIPVERVIEVKDKIEKRIKDIEYSIEFLKDPDYLEESLRSRLFRAKQEAFLGAYTLIQILLSDGK